MSLIRTKDKYSEIHLGGSIIKSSECVKALSIKIDSELQFWWSYLRSMQEKANRKLRVSALATP